MKIEIIIQCNAAIAGAVRKASFYKICLMKKLDFSSELLTARDCKKNPGKTNANTKQINFAD